MPIVEIPESLDEGVVFKTKEGYKVLPFSQLTEEQAKKVQDLEKRVEELESRTRVLIEAKLEKVVKTYTDKFDNDKTKENLVRFMAFELLNDDININGADYTSDYTAIKEWVLNPTSETPAGIKKFIDMVVDPKEKEETKND